MATRTPVQISWPGVHIFRGLALYSAGLFPSPFKRFCLKSRSLLISRVSSINFCGSCSLAASSQRCFQRSSFSRMGHFLTDVERDRLFNFEQLLRVSQARSLLLNAWLYTSIDTRTAH